MKKFKVKVQISNDGSKYLIYDKNREIFFEEKINSEIEKIMEDVPKVLGNSKKAYFLACMNGTELELLEKVDESDEEF